MSVIAHNNTAMTAREKSAACERRTMQSGAPKYPTSESSESEQIYIKIYKKERRTQKCLFMLAQIEKSESE
jgi:hypothetical protein